MGTGLEDPLLGSTILTTRCWSKIVQPTSQSLFRETFQHFFVGAGTLSAFQGFLGGVSI